MKPILFFILTWFPVINGWALSPMQSFQDLVAGEGTEGFEDGPFYSALFHSPMGLAVNSDGTKLYVADRDNNCIRVVDLAAGNQVSTLTGRSSTGLLDGPLSQAFWNAPIGLVYLPGDLLVVNDSGNNRIREIDLVKKTVQTLVGNGQIGLQDGKGSQISLGPIWSMAYLSSQKSIYFTQPDLKALRRMDLETGEVSTVLSEEPRLLHPAALCVMNGKIYISERDEGQVYELNPHPGVKKIDSGAFDWTPLGKGGNILSLTGSDDTLYALRADDRLPLIRFSPQATPLNLVTVWGDKIQDQFSGAFLKDVLSHGPMAMISDPRASRRFYIAHPLLNIVTSLRDLNLNEKNGVWDINAGGLTDFDYPFAKPSGVYRILLVGDSHIMSIAGQIPLPSTYHALMETLPKKMELMLNALAAIENLPIRFEVLMDGRVAGGILNLWPYYSVPEIAKKYDVDTVLFFLTPNYTNEVYFLRPLTQEGIPAEKVDPEYVLKPAQERIPEGLPRQWFDLCRPKNLITIENNQILFAPLEEFVKDPQIREYTARLYSRPLKLLKEKLASQKTSGGYARNLDMCLMPWTKFYPFKKEKPFWEAVLKDVGEPTLDLTDSLTAFRISFYPLSEIQDNDHYTPDGQELISFLLTEALVRQKLIPLSPAQKK